MSDIFKVKQQNDVNEFVLVSKLLTLNISTPFSGSSLIDFEQVNVCMDTSYITFSILAALRWIKKRQP